eukprot:jgi/Botrbrau1/415/Bobra.110_2s0065.1
MEFKNQERLQGQAQNASEASNAHAPGCSITGTLKGGFLNGWFLN